jgi:HSP20 family protein
VPTTKNSKNFEDAESNIGGIWQGLTGLLEKLEDLAEKGVEISKTGDIGKKKDAKGMYGFTMKVGLGEGAERKPYRGTVHPNLSPQEDNGQQEVEVHEVREPAVDIFEEKEYTLLVAEMPGIEAQDIHIEVQDDLLTLSAERGSKKYHKEILLRESFPQEKMEISCNNGIVEIQCYK